MKKMKYISYKIFIALFLVIGATACSEDAMDKVNKDKDHSVGVPAKYILADVITRTAFYCTGGDLNTYLSSYVEHEVGTHNQLFRAEYRNNEPSAASTFNNTWSHLYTNLKNSRIAITQTAEGGIQEGNAVTLGIAQLLAAYNSALIADMYGDAPWTEASVVLPNGNPAYMTPKVDKQQDIYTGIMTLLDEAIANLQKEDLHITGAMGEYDLLYNGDGKKWLKLAYGLKARYAMHLLVRAENKQAQLEEIIKYADLSFSSAGEQAAFAIYDATNLNPLFDFFWSRKAIAASQSMYNKLAERNDPRIRRVYTTFQRPEYIQVEGAADANFKMAPNGEPVETQSDYNYSIFCLAQTAPTMLMSYHEVLFLKAEALCRLGRASEAEALVKTAIQASVVNTEVAVAAAKNAAYLGGKYVETTDVLTAEEVETYFANEVLPRFTANPLKETMNQKYIAFWGASGESTECYNDIRRMKALGEDFIVLENPNPFPLRCPYGNYDTTANPNVKELYGDGQYVYTENVWWAGGSR